MAQGRREAERKRGRDWQGCRAAQNTRRSSGCTATIFALRTKSRKPRQARTPKPSSSKTSHFLSLLPTHRRSMREVITKQGQLFWVEGHEERLQPLQASPRMHRSVGWLDRPVLHGPKGTLEPHHPPHLINGLTSGRQPAYTTHGCDRGTCQFGSITNDCNTAHHPLHQWDY